MQLVLDHEKQEKLIGITVCLIITAQGIISLFVGMTRSFFILPFKMDTLFIYGLFSIIVILSLKKILLRSSLLIYAVIFLLSFGYFISFLLNSFYYSYFINIGIDFLFKSTPWLFVSYAVRDYRSLKKHLYVSALIIMISFISNMYIFDIGILEGHSYQQYYTYMLLPTAIIFADAFFNKKNIFNIFLFIIAIMLMFSMGARGPLVCVVLYLLLKIFMMYRYDKKSVFFISCFLVVAVIPLFIFFDDILKKLYIIFQSKGMSTRIIARLMQGNFFSDNARVRLFQHSIDLFKESPLLGVGLGKDRILLAEKMVSYNILTEAAGWYPHNFFLEVLLHFGLFIGGAIILFVLKIIYTSIFKNTNKDVADVISIFVGIGFFPLFFSGSYIISPLFFVLLGFCLYQYKVIKQGRDSIKKLQLKKS